MFSCPQTTLQDWWPIVEDIFSSPVLGRLETALMAELVQHDEFRCISIDATLRCCLSLLGQARPRATPVEKAQAAFNDQASLRRVA
mgnify:CR=1 FL=1